jgi:hypothetical protein
MATGHVKVKRKELTDFDSVADPFRGDWLKLSPGQRIVRAWKLMKRVKTSEVARNATSLPRL